MAKIITPECRLSYPQLLVARAMTDKLGNPQGKASFSAALVFDPSADLSALKQAVVATVVEKFGPEKAKEILSKMVPGGSVKNPLRQDIDKKYGDGTHIFINARNTTQPQCVFPYADAMSGKPKLMSKDDIEKYLYPGAYIRASLSPFWYDNSGNKGVSFGLNNIQWLRDGERLDNRVSAEDEFTAVATSAESASDLAALMG